MEMKAGENIVVYLEKVNDKFYIVDKSGVTK